MKIKKINSTAFYFKNKVFRPKAYSSFKKAQNNEENLDAIEIDEINFQKRIELVKYAYNNIPFYKNFYNDHRIDINKINNKEYWAKLPILEKEHLRNFKKDFTNKNTNPKRYRKTTTGGSTGKPLTLYRDKQFPEEIIKWRMLKRWGLSPAEDIVMLWRIPLHRNSRLSTVKNNLQWWPTKRIRIDVSSLDNEKFTYLTKKINKYKPPLIWGYVGAIDQYCQFLLQNNIELKYKPKCVWSTAAPLSKLQEKTITKALTPNILNQYACSEIHWVAANIPETKQLIVEHDFRHVDIVDNRDKNIYQYDKLGDLIITDLHNYVFPLIKYRVGDKGSFAKPDTNHYSNFPRINPVKGRVTDYIITKSGKIISGEYLTTIFDNYTNEVNQFQIHQIKINKVIVRLSLEDDTNNYFIEKVKTNLKIISNNELDFEFSIVDMIESERGKIRFVKNDLISKKNL